MDQQRAFIFDLDGVLVDTARYHYLAWQRLASGLGFELDLADNERLKGVSRMASLDIVLTIGGIEAGPEEKEEMAARKNAWYNEYLSSMDASEILPGVLEFLDRTRSEGLRSAVASASRNAMTILRATGLLARLDAVADGSLVARAKPAPDVFLKAAELLALPPASCIVFEDAVAGIEGARAAGMKSVGIGSPGRLGDANLVLPGFVGVSPGEILARLGS
ncbi:MAG TPA: beta-phosphoglucomutase [Rectinemataceae bacterium]|nr:beta-phosphoglucomutase [Rectinemataceae bacterium]